MKRYLFAYLVFVTPMALFSACSDDSSGGGGSNNYNDTNNNNTQWDATVSPDSSTSADSGMQVDAGTEPDAAAEPDSGTTPDGGGGGGNGAIGDSCTDASDCSAPTGLTADCLQTFMNFVNFPGGYCTASCTPPASPNEPDPCGPGAVCASVASQPGQCFKTCTDATECRQDEGYDCTDPMNMVGQTVCAPPIGM